MAVILPTPTFRTEPNVSMHYSAHPDDGGIAFVWGPRFDPDIVAENKYNACDSGGFYWVSKVFSIV